MNYRHIYHAGNFADVTKHLALVMILDHLKKKDAPFCVIDAHGGIGLYDLQSIESQKTLEWQEGIGRFESILYTAPHDLLPYCQAISPHLNKKHYPGSPLLSAQALRPQDRLIANELHPDDFETLKDVLWSYRNARVTHLDAYECIRAHIPPQEKRGLVLIDPPFEKTNEFQTLIRQMQEWKKRFANGIFIIWYPIKAHLAVEALKRAATDLDMKRTWCFESLLHPRKQPETFNGSGLIIMNTPYQIPERLTGLFPILQKQMDLHGLEQEWLTQP